MPPAQPAISGQHTSKLISSFVNMSMPSTMPPATSAEVPLASMAGVLLTRINTTLLMRFSSADGILLLCAFVGHRQDCLYSVTCWKSLPFCYFLHVIVKGWRLIPAQCFLLWQVIGHCLCSVATVLSLLLFLPNYPIKATKMHWQYLDNSTISTVSMGYSNSITC